jgi:hypothetical protein
MVAEAAVRWRADARSGYAKYSLAPADGATTEEGRGFARIDSVKYGNIGFGKCLVHIASKCEDFCEEIEGVLYLSQNTVSC